MKWLKWLLVVGLALLVLGAASVWSWGQFARRAVGEATQALPVSADQTALDRWATPLLAEHPGTTGAILVNDNLQAYALRAQTARHAGRSLDVQYYLWHDDLTGRALKDELLTAAERGVRVRVLIDDMNGMGLDKSLLAMDAHPNLEVRLFNPARNRGSTWARGMEMVLRVFSFNRRMHNKAWIADNRVALVGGRNIGNEYFDAAKVNFHDADLLMVGEGVAQTSAIFDEFWNSQSVIPIAAMHGESDAAMLGKVQAQREQWRAKLQASEFSAAVAQLMARPETVYDPERWHWVKQLRVLSDPPAKAGPIETGRAPEYWLMFDVLQSLFTAQKELRLISPYFVPGNTGTMLFSGMAVRGVNVGILTNSLAANDVPAVHAGYERYRQPLLQSGVRLWELKPGDRSTARAPEDREASSGKTAVLGSSGASLHTKAFIVDGVRGFVGSFNFDPRSASLNTEMGVLFEHPALAQELIALFDEAKQPNTSYQVSLASDGSLQWRDSPNGKTWDHEPETSWVLRSFTWLISLLPIESQL